MLGVGRMCLLQKPHFTYNETGPDEGMDQLLQKPRPRPHGILWLPGTSHFTLGATETTRIAGCGFLRPCTLLFCRRGISSFS